MTHLFRIFLQTYWRKVERCFWKARKKHFKCQNLWQMNSNEYPCKKKNPKWPSHFYVLCFFYYSHWFSLLLHSGRPIKVERTTTISNGSLYTVSKCLTTLDCSNSMHKLSMDVCVWHVFLRLVLMIYCEFYSQLGEKACTGEEEKKPNRTIKKKIHWIDTWKVCHRWVQYMLRIIIWIEIISVERMW